MLTYMYMFLLSFERRKERSPRPIYTCHRFASNNHALSLARWRSQFVNAPCRSSDSVLRKAKLSLAAW